MSRTRTTSTDGFVQRAIARHGDRFDYSQSRFAGFAKPVDVLCRTHGPFRTTLKSHLAAKSGGCPGCRREIILNVMRKKTTEDFVRQARIEHGDHYDYSLARYSAGRGKVTIICPEHGSFRMKAARHLEGRGCRQCAFQRIGGRRRLSFWTFVERILAVHGADRYEYELADFMNVHSIIPIHCRKHGVFRQSANNHLRGAGCPRCVQSVGEQQVRQVLTDLGVDFQEQVRFEDCRDRRALPFDFYVPELRLLIEYDGRQHVQNPELWGGDAKLAEIKRHDALKNAFAQEHNYRLLRISHRQFDEIDELVLDELAAA